MLWWSIRHPLAAKRLVERVRVAVRLLKDAVPAVGTANKLKGNFLRWVQSKRLRLRSTRRREEERRAALQRFRDTMERESA